MIDVRALEVTYGQGRSEVRAVRGVSFEVAEGESFGIVGARLIASATAWALSKAGMMPSVWLNTCSASSTSSSVANV